MGYNKVNLNKGYNMLGIQFTEVGGIAKSIGNVFTGNLPDMSADDEGYPVWNAKFLAWNGGGYDTYYWTGSVGGALFEDDAYNNVWVIGDTGEGGIANAEMAIGDGIFLWTSSENAAVTQSGEVATNATKSVSLSAGYNLVCNPFPESVPINSISFSGLPDMAADDEGYPVWNAKFLAWNGGGYDTYYWTGSIGGSLFEDDSFNNVWVVGDTGEGGVATASVGVGDAFFIWLKTANETKINFVK